MNTTNKVDWTAEVQSAVLAMKEEGQKAYTFMKQEAPEVAAEYVAWKRAEITVSIALQLGMAIALVTTSLLLIKKLKGFNLDCDLFPFQFGSALLGVFGVIVACFALSDIPKALKPWISPRITIIEGIKEVVK